MKCLSPKLWKFCYFTLLKSLPQLHIQKLTEDINTYLQTQVVYHSQDPVSSGSPKANPLMMRRGLGVYLILSGFTSQENNPQIKIWNVYKFLAHLLIPPSRKTNYSLSWIVSRTTWRRIYLNLGKFLGSLFRLTLSLISKSYSMFKKHSFSEDLNGAGT